MQVSVRWFRSYFVSATYFLRYGQNDTCFDILVVPLDPDETVPFSGLATIDKRLVGPDDAIEMTVSQPIRQGGVWFSEPVSET